MSKTITAAQARGMTTSAANVKHLSDEEIEVEKVMQKIEEATPKGLLATTRNRITMLIGKHKDHSNGFGL